MKKQLLLSFRIIFYLTLFSFNSTAQTYNWLWAQGVGGIKNDVAQSVTTDANGNIFVSGFFTSPTISFGSTTLINSGSVNVFIVKYDQFGNVLWAKCPSVTGVVDYLCYLAVDDSGNVYQTGCFGGAISFDSYNLNSGGVFLVKYDNSGNVIWAKSSCGQDYTNVGAIAVDVSGNIFITGFFYGMMTTFDSDTLINPFGQSATNSLYIAKYDRNGTVIWARNSLENYQDYSTGLKTDLSGNVFMTGYFQSSSITFGSIQLVNADNTGFPDIFLVKYDSFGNVVWARRDGGTSYDVGNAVATDALGNIYLTGCFGSSTITFGSTTLTKTGYDDVFLAKFDANGNPIWAKSASGPLYNVGNSVAVDGSGNVFVAGYFDGSFISFGSTGVFGGGPFLAKYDSNGNVLWADGSNTNTSTYGRAYSVATDFLGNVFMVGYFNGNIEFGATVLINNSLNNWEDVFVAKHGSLTGINNIQIQNDISFYPNPTNGNFFIENSNSNPEISLIIYDALGKEIFSGEFKVEKCEIDLSNQPNGIYLMKIYSGDDITTKKIIVSK